MAIQCVENHHRYMYKNGQMKKKSIYCNLNSIQNFKFRIRIQIAKHTTCPEKYFIIILLDLYHTSFCSLNCSDFVMYIYVKRLPLLSFQSNLNDLNLIETSQKEPVSGSQNI